MSSSLHNYFGAELDLQPAPGVRCDLTEKGSSGKPTVTHQCKKYALNHAALVGVDYDKITHLASHEKNVTKLHYLTLCTDAMHRCGRFL